MVNHALAYGSGDFNPHFFKIPPLVSYLLYGVYGFYFLLLKLTGLIHGVSDFENLFLGNPSSFYWLARFIFGSLLGTATIYLLYRLLKKFFSREHALVAAYFLAASFLHVRDSHYIYADIPLLFVLVACFFPIFEILKGKKGRQEIAFGFLLGTAVATKYNGVLVFFPFLLARFLSQKKKPWFDWNLMAAGMVSLFCFGALNPYSWLDPRSFFNELFGQSHSEGFSGFLHHLTYSLNGGMGVPLLLLSLAGLAWAIRGDAKRRVLACFVIIYYGVLCFFSQPYDRYALPLIPFLTFFAADILLELQKKMRFSNLILWMLIFFIALPSLVKSVLSDQLFARKDIRAVVREKVESVIPAGSRVALDILFFMPRLKPSVKQLEEKRNEILAGGHPASAQLKRLDLMLERAKKFSEPRYELYFLNRNPSGDGFLFSKPTVPYDIKRLKDRGVEYVFFAKVNKSFEENFYKDLRTNAVLLARFSPYKDTSREWPIDSQPLTGGPFLLKELEARERNGQIIELYKLAS